MVLRSEIKMFKIYNRDLNYSKSNIKNLFEYFKWKFNDTEGRVFNEIHRIFQKIYVLPKGFERKC